MFDLGWSKVLILAVVAIVVVGPKELPTLLRAVGQFIAQLRRHAAEFRSQFDEAMKSTELDQIRRDVEAIKTDAKASLRGIEQSIVDLGPNGEEGALHAHAVFKVGLFDLVERKLIGFAVETENRSRWTCWECCGKRVSRQDRLGDSTALGFPRRRRTRGKP